MMTSPKIHLRNLDKSNWKTYRFDEIAQHISERVDPNNTDLTTYIGLEHIDPESLHIRRFGTPDDVNGTKLKFYKGDIIFGRRRAYQRKAAIARMNGICSAHALVLRANPEVIDPQLFPFFMHSDLFMNRAVDISVGSLSPTINWGTLKHQEFRLPPKNMQAKFAKLLSTMESSAQSSRSDYKKLNAYYEVQLNQYMIHGLEPITNSVVKSKCGLLNAQLTAMQLKDCISEKPKYGANASSKKYEIGAPIYIRITDINENGQINLNDTVTINSDEYDEYVLKKDDFLFARTGATVGKTFLYEDSIGQAVYAGYLIRFRLNQSLLRPKFLFYFSKSLKFESFKNRTVKIGAQPNINADEYQSMYLPRLSIAAQDVVIEKLDKIINVLKVSQINIEQFGRLRSSILNQVF